MLGPAAHRHPPAAGVPVLHPAGPRAQVAEADVQLLEGLRVGDAYAAGAPDRHGLEVLGPHDAAEPALPESHVAVAGDHGDPGQVLPGRADEEHLRLVAVPLPYPPLRGVSVEAPDIPRGGADLHLVVRDPDV